MLKNPLLLPTPPFPPSTMKFALSLNAITALCLHQMTSSSASPVWLPSAGDGIESACFNQYHGGGTVLAQCGGPTTTQIANNRDSEGKLPIKEFIALTDHSIQLLDHQDVEHPWVSDFSGFGTTNWGGHEAEVRVIVGVCIRQGRTGPGLYTATLF